MNVKWFGNLKGDAKENRKKELLAAQNVLDILSEILYNMYREAEDVSATDYNNPSWSHLQAHTNGRKEALKQILKLVKSDGPE